MDSWTAAVLASNAAPPPPARVKCEDCGAEVDEVEDGVCFDCVDEREIE